MTTNHTSQEATVPWWKLLNGYHWYVLILAAFGWLFDTMDQQIFTVSRSITMSDLLPHADAATQTKFGGYATSIFILGWATGGLIFGKMGDAWGRAKTMAVTIFMYAACTGLSALANDWGWFAAFRFLTGAGVGGEFAVGASLVAEAMPEKARAHALGLLQALSAIGNIIGAKLLGIVVPTQGGLGWGWRGLYWVGALPALLAVFVFWRLKEPEKWVAAKAASMRAGVGSRQKFGRISQLFAVPRWRRNTLVGVSLAVAGVLGLWGVGFYAPELIDSAIPTLSPAQRVTLERVLAAPTFTAQLAAINTLAPNDLKKLTELTARTLKPAEADGRSSLNEILTPERKARLARLMEKALTDDERTKLKSTGAVLQQIGAFCGIYCFTFMATRWGRKISFLITLALGWASILLTFYTFQESHQIYYLWPILGFGTLAPFGGYAIYFPELFPTRLRSTGTSFCYNVGRYIAAFGPSILGPLAVALHGHSTIPGFRLAAMILGCSYLIGIIALIWAPETLNCPLPEDEGE